jgi:hypothetical protein
MKYSIFFVAMAMVVNYSHAQLPVCEATAGVVTDTRECRFGPDSYKAIVREIWICRSEPSHPTLTVETSKDGCFEIYRNSDESELTFSSENNSVQLSGDIRRPPNGVYTHAYMIVDPRISINTKVNFDSDRVARKQMSTDGSGRSCWTTSSTQWRYSDDNAEAGRVSFNYVACGASSTGQGWHTTIYNTFENRGLFVVERQMADSKLYLINNLGRIANVSPSGVGDMGDVKNILSIGRLNSFVVGDDSRGLHIKFGKSTAARIKVAAGGNEIVYFSPMDFLTSFEIY